MNNSITTKLTHALSLTIAFVLVLLPFHAFLTVWLSSIFGHYTLLRLWKEIVLLAVGLVAVGLLFRDRAMRRALIKQRLFWLVAGYTLLLLALGFISLAHHMVSGKALAYGMLDDSRFVLFFGLCLGVAARDSWLKKHWTAIILLPALVVVIFGLLQILLLPYNFLAHFGYGANTIAPYQTVNSNLHYVRIQSTLRGANPLGAYLILILAVIASQLMRVRTNRSRLIYSLFGVGVLVDLFYTYSRSAWVGALLSLACLGLVAIKSKGLKQRLALSAAVILVIATGVTLALRHNNRFESIVFHTSSHSVATTSDQNHKSALTQGLDDLAHQPFGHGTGTAGAASVYNLDGPVRIAENYFVQIGQEIGWLGLAIFIFINIFVGVALWKVRTEPLAQALWVSLIGISFVGMLSNVWADDTLSYIWWGLAGIALSPHLLKAEG
jgi:hypothetical protein